MNKRIWLGPLLLILAMVGPVGTTTAQFTRSPVSKQSHHDLPNPIGMANLEEMMAQRLQEVHELHNLQDQVQGLLQDRDFLEQIKKQFTPDDFQKLRERMLKGEGLRGDSNWNQLLQQMKSRQKLDEGKIEFLRRLVNPSNPNQPSPSENSQTPADSDTSKSSPSVITSPDMPAPLTTPPNTPAPELTLFDRMQETTTKWMVENLDSVGGDIIEALSEIKGNEDNPPLAELLRSVQQPDLSGLNISDRAIGFSRYLSDAGDYLHQQRGPWDEVRSFLRKTTLPSLPNLGVPSVSLPPPSPAQGGSWSPVVLFLLLFGLIVLFLCLRSLSTQAPPGSGDGDEWRLGSWPVPPDRVATRQDVIRAFEYLVLLCFGPAVAACHHRELAERLAEQDGDNPARRTAAEMLAWTYEQARYAPAAETLSPGQLSDARNALCLLAGVTAV